MLVYASVLRANPAVASDHAIQLTGAPGPSLIEGEGGQSFFLDGTAGIETTNNPVWQRMPEQAFRVYSTPMSMPASNNAVIACRDNSSRPPAGWSLEDIERNGELWTRLYWRDRNGVAVWVGSKDGAFKRELGRGDLLIAHYRAGEASLWANHQKIAAVAVDSDARQNTTPLRCASYALGVAIWRGYLQAPSLRVGLLRANEIEKLAPARLVPIPAPKPAVFPCLARTSGPLVTKFKDLGTIDGFAPLLKPDVGGNARYDLRGTIRETRLSDDLAWQGKRNLLNFNRSPAFDGACFSGGALICPEMIQDLNWDSLYKSDNRPRAAIDIHKTPMKNVLFEGLRGHGLGWDVVRIGQGDQGTIENLTFRKLSITMQRDDAIENDSRRDGILLDDSFIESFVLFSCRNKSTRSPDGSSRVNTVNECLVYSLPSRITDDPDRLAPIFKVDSRSVRFLIIDSIFAIPAGTPDAPGSIFGSLLNNGKLHPDSRGNTVCWLGAGACPHAIPEGFTLLTGATAQSTWANALAAWWKRFPGHRFPFDPKA